MENKKDHSQKETEVLDQVSETETETEEELTNIQVQEKTLEENVGIGKALNLGVTACSFNYIAPLKIYNFNYYFA